MNINLLIAISCKICADRVCVSQLGSGKTFLSSEWAWTQASHNRLAWFGSRYYISWSFWVQVWACEDKVRIVSSLGPHQMNSWHETTCVTITHRKSPEVKYWISLNVETSFNSKLNSNYTVNILSCKYYNKHWHTWTAHHKHLYTPATTVPWWPGGHSQYGWNHFHLTSNWFTLQLNYWKLFDMKQFWQAIANECSLFNYQALLF